jgi:hypothetical protein
LAPAKAGAFFVLDGLMRLGGGTRQLSWPGYMARLFQSMLILDRDFVATRPQLAKNLNLKLFLCQEFHIDPYKGRSVRVDNFV